MLPEVSAAGVSPDPVRREDGAIVEGSQPFGKTIQAGSRGGIDIELDATAQILSAEGRIIFGSGGDEIGKGGEAGVGGGEQGGLEGIQAGDPAQHPYGINEGQALRALPGVTEIPPVMPVTRPPEIDGSVADQQHGGHCGCARIIGERNQSGLKAPCGEEHPEEVDAGAGRGVDVDFGHFLQRDPMGDADAEDRAARHDSGAGKQVITVVEQGFRHGEQGGVETAGAEFEGESGGGEENDLPFQAMGQGCGIEIGHRPDADGGIRGGVLVRGHQVGRRPKIRGMIPARCGEAERFQRAKLGRAHLRGFP